MASYSNDKDIHLQGSDYESPVLNGKNKEVSNGSQEGIDLDHRRRAALDEVDNASFNRYHVKAVLVACIGFLTDAYDIFAISMAATMIGYVYHKGGANTANQDLGIKVSHSIGTFCGQLLFGWLADVLGRKKMYGIELMIIIIGTIGTAIAGQGPTVSIYGVLIFWRFIMGLGIGGDYPLSAIITSEFASTKIRGRMMTAVFAGQGWGNLLAAIVAIITVTGFKHQIINDTEDFKHVDYCWRILLGFGCVPAAGALYFRLTIPETPRFTMDIERNVQQAAQDVETYLSSGQFSKDPDAGVQRAEMPKATRADFFRHYGQWKNGKILFGCAWSWFALDVAFYGLGLNSSTVLTTIGFGSPNKSLTGGAKVYQNLHNIAVGNIILSAAGLVPGYWATFLFIDKVGRKPIQLMGFIILTILFFIMGGAYHKLLATTAGSRGFVAMYCLSNFFQNFGPNTTTFIIPGEAGAPTRFRSTFHGISAASGKLGAIIAQVGFSRLKDRGGKNHGIPLIFLVFGAFMASGIASTLLLPETKGRSLEELSDEDQEGFVKGPVPTNFATHI